MLHPEALPRANTVAMTKEYSFLRTTVPRGPKLGSLGIPPSKEKKSRSPRPNKIHSLADYRSTEGDGGEGGGGAGAGRDMTTADVSQGSLRSSISSVSTLSEVSTMSESSTCETDTKASTSLQLNDNLSEIDGSEAGAKAGNDGNDSDSSTYSSVSTRGTYGMLSAAVERQQGPYTVEGREIAPEAMGQFPSLQEVLQAASDEQHLLEMEQERNGTAEPRSRRDSFSSSQLEKAMVELQGSLESKNASLTSLSNDLKVSEDQYKRLMSQLQQVQLERNTLQSRLKTSQAEIDSLQQVRQWYQQQLAMAQEARVRLQSEMANMQLQSLQKEHLELMRQLTTTQENLQTKEQSINQLEARYQELEDQLAELQTESTAKEDTIQFLQNEKIVLEVALQAARADKSQLDEGAERLGEDVLVASDILDQLRQEVQIKGNQLISELKSTKKRLLAEVKDLKQELLSIQGEKQQAELEQARLQKEVARVQEQMNNMEAHLQAIQTERDQLETQIQSLQFDQSQLAAVTQENESLRKQVEQMEAEAKKAISEQKVRMKRLGTDLTSAQKEMKAKHKAYENAVGILSRRLQEALTDKETTEAELVKLRAQVSDGGNSHALQVQAVLKRKEEEDQQMKQMVATLQLALEKEKTKVKDLKEQVAAAKAEAAHNRRHYRAAMLELSEIKKDLQAKEDLVKALQSEAQKLQFQQELAEAHSQLQILRKQLDEELAKQPLTNQENIKVELDTVQEELSSTRKDKFMLQAKVGELRNSMKTVLLQNQQLKQDLKQSRLRKIEDVTYTWIFISIITAYQICYATVRKPISYDILGRDSMRENRQELTACIRLAMGVAFLLYSAVIVWAITKQSSLI
ncbi:hypothetical protein GOODEAATRI_004455 [Goodea atripinnis]|uniref:Golgin subfamily A member 3 n=1 Tax=Goodea atripinnis TaxID=208336 RepID=A0ABV0PBE1_9TELE